MAYELDDLDGMQRKAFAAIACGDIVKLVFRGDGDDGGFYVERMWVKVTSASADGFIGSLDNDPCYISNLKAGELIRFSAIHILEKLES